MRFVANLDRRARALIGALALAVTWGIVPLPLLAQAGTVAGMVRSGRTQQPIAGARVAVVGDTQVTTTDGRGRFRLAQLQGAEVDLEIHMIGFRPGRVTARIGDQAVQVVLEERAVALDEVVVTGTAGAAEKRTLGNAVGEVDASFITQRAPISDVQNLLNTRVAGVMVLPGSGNLGTGGATRIRGVSSLSLPNEPLLYVDGVRVNNDPAAGPNIRQGRQVSRMNDLNPEDIASIEIIKGPARRRCTGRKRRAA